MTISVLIADDHPIVRSGIVQELSQFEEFHIVGEVQTTDEALSATIQLTPDVLILDINMPGQIKAIEVVQSLKRADQPTRVLVLTAHRESGIVLAYIQAGTDGYLLKEEDLTSIPRATRDVANGSTWISQGVAEVLTNHIRHRKRKDSGILTGRELEVMLLVAEGMTNTEIAQQLNLTKRTVEFHITNIRDKIGARSRSGIISWAKTNRGLV